MAKQVRIEMAGHGRGEVFIDGHKVSGVTSIKFEAAINSNNTVTMTLSADSVVVDGIAEVTNIESTEREFKKVA